MSQSDDREPGSGPRASGRDTRPTIFVGTGDPPFEQALAALRTDETLFARGTDLVHVVGSTEEEAEDAARDQIPVGTPKVHVVGHEELWFRLCRTARWERDKPTAEGFVRVRTEPGDRFCNKIVKGAQFPGIRRLDGVTETPFPRPDGTLCQAPGYDRQTRYLYAPSIAFPRVSLGDHPAAILAAGRAALTKLEGVFDDFPFSAPAGRAAAVAAVATLVCRPAIRGPVPAFIIDATTPGTGKTLLADVCAGIAYGRDSGRNHFPFTTGLDADMALSKVLATIARRGAQIVNFDNVDQAVIGGDTLEQCVSARTDYTFRILGKIADLTLPWRTVVFATANNAQWSRGMDRRILHLRLESPFEKPEHRPADSYSHPERAGCLFEWAVEHRAELVHAALTLVMAYLAAGRPNSLSVGTFELWAGLVPSAIVWAGGANPLDCRPSQSGEESQDTTFARILVQGWAAFCAASGSPSLSAAAVVSALYPKGEGGRDGLSEADRLKWDDLRGAIEHFVSIKPGQAPNAKTLGDILSRRFKGAPTRTADAPAPLQRFRADGLTHGRQRWLVEDIVAPGGGRSETAVATEEPMPSVLGDHASTACGPGCALLLGADARCSLNGGPS